MSVLYFRRIREGKMTFSKVAELWREEVRELLIDEGYEELIDD